MSTGSMQQINGVAATAFVICLSGGFLLAAFSNRPSP
jgi:hypothetical protein